MNTRKIHATLFTTIFAVTWFAVCGLLPARCLAQQPDVAPPTGQSAPEGEGPRRGLRGNALVGQIQSITPGEMKIAARDGSTATVHLSAKTSFNFEQQPAKPEDFKAGMLVILRGTKSADGTWEAEAVSARTGPPRQGGGNPEAVRGEFIAGTVKAIDGTRITLKRLDETTQTIEVDENTSLHKRRESITLADIRVGDSVISRGETKDGTFAPKSLNVVDPEQLQKMLQFMGGGGQSPGTNPPPALPPQTPPPNGKPPQELR